MGYTFRDNGRIMIIVLGIWIPLCTILVAVRCYVRIQASGLRSDDYMLLFGVVGHQLMELVPQFQCKEVNLDELGYYINEGPNIIP